MVRVHSDAPISFLAHFIPVQPRAGAANSLSTSKLTSSPRVPGKAEWHKTFFIRPGKALTTSKNGAGGGPGAAARNRYSAHGSNSQRPEKWLIRLAKRPAFAGRENNVSQRLRLMFNRRVVVDGDSLRFLFFRDILV